MKKLVLLALWMVLMASGGGVQASVIDAPHNETNDIKCGSCHTYSLWWRYSPAALSATLGYDVIVNTLCMTCHDSQGPAPVAVGHSGSAMESNTYHDGLWVEGCTVCHNPHKQSQFNWTRSSVNPYLVTGKIDTVAPNTPAQGQTTATYSEAINNSALSVWPTTSWNDKSANHPGRGLILVHNKTEGFSTFSVLSATETEIVVKGIINPSDISTTSCAQTNCANANTFGLLYGQLIRDAINTPASGGKQVKFFDPKGGFVDTTDTPATGICQVCHTLTHYWDNDGSNATHNIDVNCSTCHPHDNGFKPDFPPHDDATVNKLYVVKEASCIICHTGTDPVLDIHKGSCSYCHNPQPPTLATPAVDDSLVIAIQPGTCFTCHGATFTHPDATHSNITGPDCASCHDTTNVINGIHKANCLACHSSTKPLVIDAITTGKDGTVLTCEDCHDGTANGALIHGTTPEDVADLHDKLVASPKCNGCHTTTTAVERLALHPACTTCHNYTGNRLIPAVVAATISAGRENGGTEQNCENCHTVNLHHLTREAVNNSCTVTCHSTVDHSAKVAENAACVSCHPTTAGTASGISISPTDATIHDACRTCHTFDANLRGILVDFTNQKGVSGSGALPPGGGDCTVCHTVATATPTATTMALFHHTSPHTAVGQCETCHADPRPGWKPVGPGDNGTASGLNRPTQMACLKCHVKFTSDTMTVTKFTRTNYTSFGSNWTRTTAHTLPVTSGRINNYGICLNCHYQGSSKVPASAWVTLWHAHPSRFGGSDWTFYDQGWNSYAGKTYARSSSYELDSGSIGGNNYAHYIPGRSRVSATGIFPQSGIAGFNFFAPNYGFENDASAQGQHGVGNIFTRGIDHGQFTGPSWDTPLFTRITIPTVPQLGDPASTILNATTRAVPVFESLAPITAPQPVPDEVKVKSATQSGGVVTVRASTSNEGGCATLTASYGNVSNSMNGSAPSNCTATFASPTYPTGGSTVNVTTSNGLGLDVLGYPISAANPGALAFSATTYTVAEDSITATITVSRLLGSSGAVGVNYATASGGTAVEGTDYTATSATLTWGDGDTEDKTFPVTIIDNATWAVDKTVNLALSSPTGSATLANPHASVLTIANNELPPDTITVQSANYNGNNIIITATHTVGACYTLTAEYGNLSAVMSGINTCTATLSGTNYPALGETVNVLTSNNLGVNVTGFPITSLVMPPTLSISEPNGTDDKIVVEGSYNITYSLADPDSVVTVDFYYDTDNTGLNGSPIYGCQDQVEGENVTCTWDTTGRPAGTYYIYAITSDGFNPQVSSYSPGPIIINSAPTLSIPYLGNIVVTVGESCAIPYTLADQDDEVTAAFYYGEPGQGTPIPGCEATPEGAETCTWDTTGVAPGSYWIYAITDDGTNPPLTRGSYSYITIHPVGYNAPPVLRVFVPPTNGAGVYAGYPYNLTYSLEDTDNVVTAAFYYETHRYTGDGNAIAGCETAGEGTNVTCAWDTTGMTPGDYYVYSITSDGVNPAVKSYSPGMLTISSAPTELVARTDFSSTNVDTAATNDKTLGGTYVVPDRTDRLLLVALHYETNSAASVVDVSGTYGGQALTQVNQVTSGKERMWVGYLKESGLALATNTTLTVTMSANTGSAILKAGSFINVNQTTPINHSVKNSNDNQTFGYTFGTTALMVKNGGRAIFFNTHDNETTRQTTNYLLRYDHGDTGSHNFALGSAYKNITADGTENPTITLSPYNGYGYGLIAVSLQPSNVPPPVPLSVQPGTEGYFTSPPVFNDLQNNTLSGNYTVPAGQNRLLLMALHYVVDDDPPSLPINLTAVTYGGQLLTEVQRIDGANSRVWVGYLKESGIAAASSTTLEVTMSASPGRGGAVLNVGSFSNVDQNTPINDSVQNASNGLVSTCGLTLPGIYGPGRPLSVVKDGRAIFFNTYSELPQVGPPWGNFSKNLPQGYTELYELSGLFTLGGADKAIMDNGTEDPYFNFTPEQRYGMVGVSLQPVQP